MTEDVEAEVFGRMWTWLNGQRETANRLGLSLAVYVWHASAENTVARRIASAVSEDLADQVEELIASDTWVDLKRVFERNWLTGGSTGLKAIAPLAGYEWPVDDAGVGKSMVKYLEAVGQGAEEARQWILDYNRGDVEGTQAIREWLCADGSTWPVVEID